MAKQNNHVANPEAGEATEEKEALTNAPAVMDNESQTSPEDKDDRQFEVFGIPEPGKVFFDQQQIDLFDCSEERLKQLYDSGLRQYIRVKEAK